MESYIILFIAIGVLAIILGLYVSYFLIKDGIKAKRFSKLENTVNNSQQTPSKPKKKQTVKKKAEEVTQLYSSYSNTYQLHQDVVEC